MASGGRALWGVARGGGSRRRVMVGRGTTPGLDGACINNGIGKLRGVLRGFVLIYVAHAAHCIVLQFNSCYTACFIKSSLSKTYTLLFDRDVAAVPTAVHALSHSIPTCNVIDYMDRATAPAKPPAAESQRAPSPCCPPCSHQCSCAIPSLHHHQQQQHLRPATLPAAHCGADTVHDQGRGLRRTRYAQCEQAHSNRCIHVAVTSEPHQVGILMGATATTCALLRVSP